MGIDDVMWYKGFKKNFTGTITKEEVERISRMHSDWFNHSFYIPCNCKGNQTLKNWVLDIDKKIKDEYK